MPKFVFEALDSNGKTIRSEVEAASNDEALKKIRSKNLMPTKLAIKAQKDGRATSGARARSVGGKKKTMAFGGVSSKQLTQFTRQFSTLIDAGLPIVRALDILESQLKPSLLKNALMDVKEDVEGGNTLSDSLSKHPKVFDNLYVNMIKAGEAGGVLDIILARLADFREKSQRLRRQIIGALVYPAAVITIATLILIAIFIYVIPSFEKTFRGMNVELPGSTQLLMAMAKTMQNFWFLIPGIPIVLFVAYKLIRMSSKGAYATDFLKLHIPVFGQIISKSSVSRFCRTLGTLISSGVPILEALSIIRNTTGNEVVSRAVTDVHASIREGDTIAEPLKNSGVFDDMVVNMIDVGEETGELDKMLIKIADNYDNEVDVLVSSLMSLLEPVLIICLGIIVGFIVISLFYPLISLMDNISKKGN